MTRVRLSATGRGSVTALPRCPGTACVGPVVATNLFLTVVTEA